jgi:hypothetical protein
MREDKRPTASGASVAATTHDAPRRVAWSPVLEAMVSIVFLIAQALTIELRVLSLDALIRVNTAFLLLLFFAAWKRFRGGMHICFLFLGTLILFQAGRMVAFTFNPFFGQVADLMDPFDFVLMREVPFGVAQHVAEMTMLLIVTSAVCVYLPCSMRFRPATLPGPLRQDRMRGLYRIYFATFPFILYKDVRYLMFIRAHGGYLAVYLNREGLLASVDPVTRLLAFVAGIAFVLIFLFEPSRRRVFWITFTYLFVSTLDLLIGLRGKVFTLLLALWFINNLKRHKHFRIGRLVLPAFLIMYVAMFAASFRENQSVELLNPLAFLAEQGISMQVTEAVVGFRNDFVRSPSRYLLNELEMPFSSKSQVQEPDGESLAGDLTQYLSPVAASQGYGTGSSYIAEGFLFGGFFGVIVISLLLGYGLSWVHLHSGSVAGGILLAYMMPTLIYLPRSTLFDPLSLLVKTAVALLLGFPVFYVATKFPRMVLMKRLEASRGLDAD